MAQHDKSVQFLREERARKLDAIEVLSFGNFSMREWSDGVTVDTTDVLVSRMRRHVAQMEDILTSAGEPFDA